MNETQRINFLREDMVIAFYVWSRATPMQRGHFWDDYTNKREAYLKAVQGDRYRTLQMVEYFAPKRVFA